MRGLQDKIAIVAGGGSGIGAATAERLAAEGASVVVGDVVADNADAVARAIVDGGGRATAVTFDIADEASVDALVTAACATYGGVDLVHVNAADLSANTVGRDSDAVSIPLDVFDRTIEVNLRGHLLVTRRVVPELLTRGGGALVYTTSAAAFVGEPTRPSYGMAKAGLNALTRHVASKWGKEGVRANAVAPGYVVVGGKTPTPALVEQAMERMRSTRMGTPADIAAAVTFLLSDDAEWINGQVLSVDGGSTLR